MRRLCVQGSHTLSATIAGLTARGTAQSDEAAMIAIDERYGFAVMRYGDGITDEDVAELPKSWMALRPWCSSARSPASSPNTSTTVASHLGEAGRVRRVQSLKSIHLARYESLRCCQQSAGTLRASGLVADLEPTLFAERSLPHRRWGDVPRSVDQR